MLGLAAGDALGTTLEFKAPGTFEPLDDIVGGGVFHIALDGQTPIQYAPNLSISKTSDAMLDIAVARLEEHYCQDISNGERSFKAVAVYIAQQTLHLDWNQRIKSLRSIRGEISGA